MIRYTFLIFCCDSSPKKKHVLLWAYLEKWPCWAHARISPVPGAGNEAGEITQGKSICWEIGLERSMLVGRLMATPLTGTFKHGQAKGAGGCSSQVFVSV